MNGKSSQKENTRIDVHLVEKGFAPSRTKAQELIQQGLVSVRTATGEKPISSASETDYEGQILIRQHSLSRYVSRGGVKLEKALEHVKLGVRGFRILDVGISTGGFTDCLLQQGAQICVGVDVGHSQLSPRLQSDPRVKIIEGVNARSLSRNHDFLNLLPAGGFDLAVLDVSFISLLLVLPQVFPYTRRVLSLVKPQFEVGPENIKNGIVKDAKLFETVKEKITTQVRAWGYEVEDYFESAIEGKDGNKEFFIYIRN